MIDWTAVGSSVVVAAVISGALGPVTASLALRRVRNEDATAIATVREELRRETSRIDSERALLATRVQTQFSWLYEERAKVMLEIYGALLDARDAFEDFLNSWGSLPGDTQGPTDKWQRARDAGDHFLK